MQINSENERIKKRYLDRLKGADGLSVASITSISRAIHKYEVFSNFEDYRLISASKVESFKRWLLGQQVQGKAVTLTTAYHVLRHVRGFFKWLSGESKFKSQNLREAISYLKLDQNQTREALAEKFTEAPSLDYVRKLVLSIEPIDEPGMRDRALISFLLLTGMRDLAVATLPLGCFDRVSFVVHQDPAKGVRTKRRKTIHSKLLEFDDVLVQAVLDWYDYLVSNKKFKETDPLFPQTNVRQADDGFSFVACGVKPEFWRTASPIREILSERSERAGLPYFKPHSFRHAAARLVERFCITMEQFRAVSQNFGHENIGTTLRTYGKLDTHRVIEVVGTINFDPTASGTVDDAQIDKAIELLISMKKKKSNLL